jgi:uncharacterized protein YecE (DUF72 family)
MYYSSYSPEYLDGLADRLRAIRGTPAWCIFDNTARGAAVLNAIDVRERLARR